MSQNSKYLRHVSKHLQRLNVVSGEKKKAIYFRQFVLMQRIKAFMG